MLKKEDMKSVAELIGMAAIVASLIFVGLQLRQNEQIAVSDGFANWSDRAGMISQLITDHAAVWTKACAGDDLTAEERTIASEIFARIRTQGFLTWMNFRGGIAQTNNDTPAERLAQSAWRYPGFRAMLEESVSKDTETRIVEGSLDSATRAFRNRVISLLAEFDTEKPEPDVKVTWCGRF